MIIDWHELAIELQENGGFGPTVIQEILYDKYGIDVKYSTVKQFFWRRKKK